VDRLVSAQPQKTLLSQFLIFGDLNADLLQDFPPVLFSANIPPRSITCLSQQRKQKTQSLPSLIKQFGNKRQSRIKK
jgi:hypothetical protein